MDIITNTNKASQGDINPPDLTCPKKSKAHKYDTHRGVILKVLQSFGMGS